MLSSRFRCTFFFAFASRDEPEAGWNRRETGSGRINLPETQTRCFPAYSARSMNLTSFRLRLTRPYSLSKPWTKPWNPFLTPFSRSMIPWIRTSVRELPAQQVKMLLEQHIDDAEKNLGTHCSLRFRFAEFFSGCLLNYSRSILC